MLACCWGAPASAEWRRAESPNFIVFGEASEARLRERIRQLEEFDRLLRIITTVRREPSATKFTVYLVTGANDLRILRNVPTGVAGFYTATPDGMAAFADTSAAMENNAVLFHEYVHHFMWQYAPSAYPAWYVEAFAEYFMTAYFRDGSVDIGNFSRGRGYSITGGTWLPIERVLFGTVRGLNRDDAPQYYAQAWLILHYFYATDERRQAMQRYLDAISSGTDPGEALPQATGLTPAQLQAALRTYIAGGRIAYRRMQWPATQPPPITVTLLPRSANDLLLYQASLRVGVAPELQARNLDRIRAAAARHGEDPFARRVLAHAELLYGDAATGERLLDSLLAAAPQDAELLYLKGMRHLLAFEKGENPEANARLAQRFFSRAHRIDGNHYQTLFRFAQSLQGSAQFESENTSNILLLAHQLAPQVNTIRMNAARMLISRGEVAHAEALLRPLISNQHDESLAQAAQQLLDSARTPQTPPQAPPSPAATPAARQ